MEVQTQPSNHVTAVTLMRRSNWKIIRHKVGLLNLAGKLGNVSSFGIRSIWLHHDLTNVSGKIV